jgi:hypothetical protein
LSSLSLLVLLFVIPQGSAIVVAFLVVIPAGDLLSHLLLRLRFPPSEQSQDRI